MCGILGVYGNIPDKNIIENAIQSLAHRGPDDQGIYYDENDRIALAHRRLSIIDLSKAGHQPFYSSDRRYVLVFNGEIYNYLEIKEELKDCYEFRTKTDTEVLLAAYIKWKEKCLDRFNGMFAFAVWDTHQHTLFCARDRLGIKPFYYCLIENSFYFSSEIKGLFKLGITPTINDDMVYDYLCFGYYDHSEDTFYQSIKKLSAGHYMELNHQRVSITQYWDLAEIKCDFSHETTVDILQRFRELLHDSITLRFRSDVPVGVNLSSGLDSNSLLYYAYKVTGRKDIHLFSMGFTSDEYDECSIISGYLTAQQKKYWHTSYLKPDDVLDYLKKMNRIQDQPFGGVPTLAYGRLNELIKSRNITVILEGQGVDELLAGYRYYKVEYEKDKMDKQSSIHISSSNRSQDMTKLINQDVIHPSFRRNRSAPSFATKFSSHLLNAQYRDIVHTKLPRVLRFNDHVSMACSRELRVPFLDHRIVEFCFWLPTKYKINGDRHKCLMRDTMAGILPEMVNAKAKQAFGMIQTEWFRNAFQKEIMSTLQTDFFKDSGYWDYNMLVHGVREFFSGKGDNSFFIWQCLNLNEMIAGHSG